jgi:hypothetical protein
MSNTPSALRPGEVLRRLADEVADPIAAYKNIPAWREQSIVALSHAAHDLSLWAIQFEAATRELSLPDPALAESWDAWQFEESVRKAAALLVGAAAELDQRSTRDSASVAPEAVRNAIAESLAEHVKAYDLPDICVGLGLAPGAGADAYSSKRVYVKSRLLQKRGEELIAIGQAVIDEYGDSQLDALLDRFREQRGVHASPGAALVGERIAQLTDWDGVQRACRAALDKVIADPDGAITAARTMLESVCKHICDERGVTYEAGWDLSRLYKAAASAMNLAPDQHAEQVIKQILSGVTSVVGGLAALRNSMSDAHGRGKRSVGPAPRHAKLAVNSALAVAGFLIDTHVERPAPAES